jgi:hypothetical protein
MRRFRLTYANVVSTMALVLALGGGAYAATTQGAVQKQAPLAPIFTPVLGHHQTERGVFDAGGLEAGGALLNSQMGAVSFAYPLSFNPVGHILNPGQKTTACPGTVRNPQAKAGHLCLYEGGNWNIGPVTFLDPRKQGAVGISKWGFILNASATNTGIVASFDWHGTWAVTAP